MGSGIVQWLTSCTPWQLLWVFSLVNLINNLDRGIIPGAFENIQDFINSSTGSSQTNALQGVLQSSFIIGFSVSCVVFGHLVHHYPPFKLMTLGLVVWVMSAVLSGLASGFYMLAFARVLSGVGEASFQCVVPPFLDTNAPPEKRGMWLGIFYFASPVGTALGYAWGGVLGSSPLTWRAAFLLEIAPVAIFLPLLWVAPYHRRRVGDGAAAPMAASDVAAAGAESEHHPLISGGGDSSGAAESRAALALSGDIASQGVGTSALSDSLPSSPRPFPEQPVEPTTLSQPLPQRPSFIAELHAAMTNVLFLLIALGNAGWTAVIMGLGAFGPTFTLGLGMFDTQSKASTALGGSIAAAAIVGTLVGSWLLDWEVKRRRHLRPSLSAEPVAGKASAPSVDEDDEASVEAMQDLKLCVALRQNFLQTIAGSAVLSVAVLVAPAGAPAFMTCVSLGFTLLLSNITASGLAVMSSVPPASRAFAIGLNALLLHLLGDVPSPPIIGYIADSLSPQTCVGSDAERVCSRRANGLQTTLGLVVLWLVWPCALWCAAWLLVEWRSRTHAAARARAAVTAVTTAAV